VLLPALAWGTGPGLFAAVLGTAALNLFYVRPDALTKHEFIGFVCFPADIDIGGTTLFTRQKNELRKISDFTIG
jgi:hypothetical protein